MTEIADIKTFIIDSLLMGDSEIEITDQTKLFEEAILDSFSLIRLVAFIEEKFSVKIEGSDINDGHLQDLYHIERLIPLLQLKKQGSESGEAQWRK